MSVLIIPKIANSLEKSFDWTIEMTIPVSNAGTFWPLQPVNGSAGSIIKMASNFFQVSSDVNENLYAYSITYEPELNMYPVHDQVTVERQLNEELKSLSFGPFFCKSRQLYSRMKKVC